MGLSRLAAEEIIAKLGVCGGVFVGCDSSPESEIISRDAYDIDILVTAAQIQGAFTRLLRTDGKACHSPHMATVGKQYEELKKHVLKKVSRYQLIQTQGQYDLIGNWHNGWPRACVHSSLQAQ